MAAAELEALLERDGHWIGEPTYTTRGTAGT
jgi:hypothetical protein